ncbi:protein N-terminal glutamine amidohydrolase isoform X2 [Periophthalmus magnuspinnatus]|uniref:protein N-terminal glutamine amidohydrolase isoform X2 n=1 Tax=Periophthalmus magnuspinnatus TaxID=409849 RepID=UPI00243736D3|nr:protein N-terminal glutamine amidohydrolase isoform X2 [Periophthalmus magnuspinnatus]
MKTPRREDCVYTSCYCEENVWHLCSWFRSEAEVQLQELYVLFISNHHRTDYHVVLLWSRPSLDPLIFDLDSVLDFPCSLQEYTTQALRSDQDLNPQYHRLIRVIPADLFLQKFSSDRSHMKKPDGTWTMPPPSYPPIQTQETSTNLELFIQMKQDQGLGQVHSLQNFITRFSQDPNQS